MVMASAQQIYHPLLTDGEPQIRLLACNSLASENHRWSLDVYSIRNDSLPKYVAMSYQWEPETFSTQQSKPILINGQTFNVRPNLFLMLQSLQEHGSHDEPRKYWIDAICINQDDVDERSYQVSFMDRIFKSAERVCIWLAPTDSAESDTDAAMDLVWQLQLVLSMQAITNVQGVSSFFMMKLKDPSAKRAWEGLAVIAAQAYWRRGWIVQEISLAAEAIVLCGTKTASAASLGVLFAFLLHFGKFLQGEGCAGMTRDSLLLLNRLWGTCGNASNVLSTHFMPGPGFAANLLQAVARFGHHETTDPRDMIYAFLGLSDTPSEAALTVDYSAPWEQVFRHATMFMIRTSGRLEVLKFAGGLNAGLPSWVPHFAKQRLGDNTNVCGAGYDCFALKATRISEVFRPNMDQSAYSFMLDSIYGCLTSLHSEMILSVVAIPITSQFRLLPKGVPDEPSDPAFDYLTSIIIELCDVLGSSFLSDTVTNALLENKLLCVYDYAVRMLAPFFEISNDGAVKAADFVRFARRFRRDTDNVLNPADLDQIRLRLLQMFSIQHKYIIADLPAAFSLFEDFSAAMEYEKSTEALEEDDWNAMKNMKGLPSLVMCRGYDDIREGDQLTVVPGCSLPLILRPEPPSLDKGQPEKMRIISEAWVYGLNKPVVLAQMLKTEIHIV